VAFSPHVMFVLS